MTRYLLIGLGFFLLSAGCQRKAAEVVVQEPEPVSDHLAIEEEEVTDIPQVMDPVVYYERTHCFGTCPVFTFTMTSSGKCTYEGRNFVDMIGVYEADAGNQAIDRIIEAAEAVNYFGLQDSYDDPMVMDLPASITRINGKEVMKRMGGPDLRSLYSVLDELIEELEWTAVRNTNRE